MKNQKSSTKAVVAFFFIIFIATPFACKNNENVQQTNEAAPSVAYDAKKVVEFTDFFMTKLAITKTLAYTDADSKKKLDFLLENTNYDRVSFQTWAKSLDIAGKTMANARTSAEVSLTDEQSLWIGKMQTELEKTNTKSDCYNSLDKIEAEVKTAAFKTDKVPVLIAISVARATVEKAFDESQKQSGTPNGRVSGCGFWRWTCIVTTTAIVGALGYISGGILGGGIMAVAAYDIAKCCICCPGSCSNSWFCYFKVPESNMKISSNDKLYA